MAPKLNLDVTRKDLVEEDASDVDYDVDFHDEAPPPAPFLAAPPLKRTVPAAAPGVAASSLYAPTSREATLESELTLSRAAAPDSESTPFSAQSSDDNSTKPFSTASRQDQPGVSTAGLPSSSVAPLLPPTATVGRGSGRLFSPSTSLTGRSNKSEADRQGQVSRQAVGTSGAAGTLLDLAASIEELEPPPLRSSNASQALPVRSDDPLRQSTASTASSEGSMSRSQRMRMKPVAPWAGGGTSGSEDPTKKARLIAGPGENSLSRSQRQRMKPTAPWAAEGTGAAGGPPAPRTVSSVFAADASPGSPSLRISQQGPILQPPPSAGRLLEDAASGVFDSQALPPPAWAKPQNAWQTAAPSDQFQLQPNPPSSAVLRSQSVQNQQSPYNQQQQQHQQHQQQRQQQWQQNQNKQQLHQWTSQQFAQQQQFQQPQFQQRLQQPQGQQLQQSPVQQHLQQTPFQQPFQQQQFLQQPQLQQQQDPQPQSPLSPLPSLGASPRQQSQPYPHQLHQQQQYEQYKQYMQANAQPQTGGGRAPWLGPPGPTISPAMSRVGSLAASAYGSGSGPSYGPGPGPTAYGGRVGGASMSVLPSGMPYRPPPMAGAMSYPAGGFPEGFFPPTGFPPGFPGASGSFPPPGFPPGGFPPFLQRQFQIPGAGHSAAQQQQQQIRGAAIDERGDGGSSSDDSDGSDAAVPVDPAAAAAAATLVASEEAAAAAAAAAASAAEAAAAAAVAVAAAAAEEAALYDPDAPVAKDLGPMLYGRPIGMPRLDHNFNPEYTGRNYIFFSAIGYVIAVCMQSASLQVGAGAAGWFYFAAVALGYIAFSTKLRRVAVYYMDVMFMLLFIIIWGLTFPRPLSGANPMEIKLQIYFPFIVNAPIAGLALISALMQYPMTENYIRETSPEEHWGGDDVRRAANYTCAAWFFAALLSTVLYLIPFRQDSYNEWPGQYSTNDGGSLNPVTLVIRIILPLVFYMAAVLMTRFWYLVWWLRPSWLPVDEPVELEGEALDAADAEEAKLNTGQKGAARRFISDNYIFFSTFGLLAVTCWQLEDIRIGLAIGAFYTLASIGAGGLFWWKGLRKTKVYSFEVLMFVLFLILFGLCFPAADGGGPSTMEWILQNNLDFIVFSVLGGGAMISIVLMQPFTLPYIQETVPRHHWPREAVTRAAWRTTVLWATSFTISVMVYLIAFKTDKQNRTAGRYGSEIRGNDGAAAVICRVVLPAVLFALSAIATRFWWRVWLIGPEGDGRPTWMGSEEAHMADASAGAEAATIAGNESAAGTESGLATAESPDAAGAAAVGGVRLAASGERYLVCTEWIGPNYQLFSLVGLIFATAWQTRNVRIGAGFAAFFYTGSIFFGSMVWRAGLRKVPVYWQEVALGSIFLLLWAISYPVKEGEGLNSLMALNIQNYFPFIVNAIMAGLSLASILFQRPFTLQFVLETVLEMGWSKTQLLPASYYTSLIWFMAHCLALFAYLIVFLSKIQSNTQGQYRTGGTDGQDNIATVILRIVVPIVLYIIAALATRFWYLMTRPPWAIPALKPKVKEVPPVVVAPVVLEPVPEPELVPEPEAVPIIQTEEADYLQQYEEYMKEMWRQYELYMQQYMVPPPPPVEPPKQADNVPRYALLPEGKAGSQGGAGPGGMLGWGDEASWANAAAAASWQGQMQGPFGRWLDANYIFISSTGYIIATCLQSYQLRTGCGVAAFVYLSLLGLGVMLRQAGVRKVWVFFMEAAMLVIFIVQWALTFPDGADGGPSERELTIQRNFPFITNGALAGVALLSSVVQYPFTLQYIRSMLPYAAWRHPLLIPVAQASTWIWVTTYTASALLYLAPYSKGVEMDSNNALTIVFRIVVPIVLHLIAMLITRLWPLSVIRHVTASEEFNHVQAPPSGYTVTDNPLSLGAGRNGLSNNQSNYVTTAADDAYVTYFDTLQLKKPPWQQQNGSAGRSYAVGGAGGYAGSYDQKASMQMQHEVWRQLMEQQKSQLLRQQPGSGLQQQQPSWPQQQEQQQPYQQQPLQQPSLPSSQPSSNGSKRGHNGQQQRQRMDSVYPLQSPLEFDEMTMAFKSYNQQPPHPLETTLDSPRIPAYLDPQTLQQQQLQQQMLQQQPQQQVLQQQPQQQQMLQQQPQQQMTQQHMFLQQQQQMTQQQLSQQQILQQQPQQHMTQQQLLQQQMLRGGTLSSGSLQRSGTALSATGIPYSTATAAADAAAAGAATDQGPAAHNRAVHSHRQRMAQVARVNQRI